MDEKRVILRLHWTGPVPAQAPHAAEDLRGLTELGMQSGRDVVVQGDVQPDGSICYDAAVTAYQDAQGRLRFRGPCVQGKPEEPFLYLSFRHKGSAKGWIAPGKAHLSSLTEALFEPLPDGAVLESSMTSLGHRPRGHVQMWTRVAG